MSDQKELRDTLQALKSEIKQVEPESEEQRDLLRGLLRDIQAFLGREGELSEPDDLTDKIENGIDQLEATHPKLTLYLNDALQMLSSLGI